MASGFAEIKFALLNGAKPFDEISATMKWNFLLSFTNSEKTCGGDKVQFITDYLILITGKQSG